MNNNKISFNFKDFYKKFELGCILKYDQSQLVFRNSHSRIYLIGRLTEIIKNMENFHNLYLSQKRGWTVLFWADKNSIKLHEYHYATLLISIMASLLFEETDQKIRLSVQDAFRGALDVFNEDADLTHLNVGMYKDALVVAIEALTECANNPILKTYEGVYSCLLSDDARTLKRNGIIARRALDEIQTKAVSLLGKYY